MFQFAVSFTESNVNLGPLNAQACVCTSTEMAKLDSRLSVHFRAVAFLHVAYKLSRYGFSDRWMDTLATLFGHDVDGRHNCHNSASLLSLDKAAKLMKSVANKSCGTMSLIAIELSKAYLYSALKYKDSDSDSIYCLANVYLAVLYYTTRQYQTAIDHCTLVMRSQDHSQCSSHVVQGELLPKIDYDVDNMLGLAVLYQYIQVETLNHQCPAKYVSVLTTELFAYYLHFNVQMRGLFMQMLLNGDFKRYVQSVSDTVTLFIGDVLLFVSLSRSIKHIFCRKPIFKQSVQPAINLNEHSTSDLSEILQKSAVEHLTTFRQIEKRDFGSVATLVTTDFEALYAYKLGDYQRCLQLSTQNVHTLLCAASMPLIPTFPEFIQLMDDDIVSLTALTLLVNPKCRVQGDERYSYITQVTLSLYLMIQCQLKLHHPVTPLAVTHYYSEYVRRRLRDDRTLDKLTLKLIERKFGSYIRTFNISRTIYAYAFTNFGDL